MTAVRELTKIYARPRSRSVPRKEAQVRWIEDTGAMLVPSAGPFE